MTAQFASAPLPVKFQSTFRPAMCFVVIDVVAWIKRGPSFPRLSALRWRHLDGGPVRAIGFEHAVLDGHADGRFGLPAGVVSQLVVHKT